MKLDSIYNIHAVFASRALYIENCTCLSCFQSVLAVKKEEKVNFKKEASERKRRINELDAALRKEEEERLALVTKKLKVLLLPK